MSSIPDYVFDPERLALLASFGILDSEAEPGFDDIVQLASLICDTPVALVSFVSNDRQWFKARTGFESCETDLSRSVCAHALVQDDLLIIPDLTADPRTSANPLVVDHPKIRFYAGAPLRTSDGHVLGSLCVIDGKPRPGGLTAGQAAGLRNLGRQVMSQLELRKALARQQDFLVNQADADARRAGLLTLGDQLRDVTTTAEMTRAASKVVGETLGASRAGFGLLSEDGQFVDVESDWAAPGVASVAGRHRFADYGRLTGDIMAGQPLIITDVTTDPRTVDNTKALFALDIRSLLNVSVRDHGRPVAIFYVHFDRPNAWPAEVVAFLRNVADRVEIGVARLKAEAQQRVLNHELSHRMKNTLAMVQAIAGQTLKGVENRNAVEAFVSRLHALSTAHEVLLKQSWMAADLGEVIRNVSSTIQSASRFEISGPALSIGPRATLSLSLLIHELSTNAVKYGALSRPGGKVVIAWRIEEDTLHLSWRDKDGPEIAPPAKRGFGSRLIQLGLIGTGGVELRYPPSGFEGDFRAPLPEVQRS